MLFFKIYHPACLIRNFYVFFWTKNSWYGTYRSLSDLSIDRFSFTQTIWSGSSPVAAQWSLTMLPTLTFVVWNILRMLGGTESTVRQV